MAGITRIKIKSNWHDWRTEMAEKFAPTADDLYRRIYERIGMKLDDGLEIVECTKDEAQSRYDWQEGIDVILNSSGVRSTVQEKYLTYWESTVTFEERKTSGEPGAWYYCTAQYWFTGYARQYWDYKERKVIESPVIDFQDWMLVDLASIRRASAANKIPWRQDKNEHDRRRATFRYVSFDDVPQECVVSRRKDLITAPSPIQSAIHWPEYPKDDHPTMPLATYQDWIKRKISTPEQLARYAQAVDWYMARKIAS